MKTLKQEERATGLGGSDAGAVLGLSPWASPLDVYREKVEGIDPVENEAMRWGILLEDLVAQEWTRRTGITLSVAPTMRHEEHEWMYAHVDRLGTDTHMVWEGKTASLRLAHEWGPTDQTFDSAADAADQIPAHYVAQVCHYMAVTGLPVAAIAALIGGQELRSYWIHRDMAFERILIERLQAFWHENVLAGQPPEPQTHADLARLHPIDDGSEVVADAACVEALQSIHSAQGAIREAESAKKEAQYVIKRHMGNATTLVDVEGVRLATWRREGNRTSRTFRASKIKEEPDAN